jgi:hypothetical protein
MRRAVGVVVMVVVWLDEDAVKAVDHALDPLVAVLDAVASLTEIIDP